MTKRRKKPKGEEYLPSREVGLPGLEGYLQDTEGRLPEKEDLGDPEKDPEIDPLREWERKRKF